MQVDAGLAVVLGAVVGVIGIIIGLALDWWKTRKNSQDARRTERYKYLNTLMQQLGEAYMEYEEYLGEYQNDADKGNKEAEAKHARIIGKAIAACLAASDFEDSDTFIECLDTPADADTYQRYKACVERYKERLTFIALRRLTRNFVDNEDWVEVKVLTKYKNRNREALNDAMRRLAQLISRELK